MYILNFFLKYNELIAELLIFLLNKIKTNYINYQNTSETLI
jgi:hypothetical protein